MKEKKPSKKYTIYSENEKLDTSGMAGKPVPMDMYVYEIKMPTMNLRQMMETKEHKEQKK